MTKPKPPAQPNDVVAAHSEGGFLIAVRAFVRWTGRSGKRVAVTIVGLVVLAGGLVMIVTPGPGIIGIIGGLAILGTEYAWAQRWLARVRAKAKQAARSMRRGFFGKGRGDG